MATIKSPYKIVMTMENGKKLMGCDMTFDDIDEATELISLNFSTFNPLYKHLELSIHDLKIYFRRVFERSISEGLALKAIDMDTNKIISATIQYDLYNYRTNPIDTKGLNPKIFEIWKMHDQLGPKIYPKKPGAIVCAALAGIHPDYYGLKIISKFGEIVWEEHPIHSTYPIVYTLATSPLSTKMNISHGYKRLKVYHPKDYVNEKGERPFATIDDTVKKMGIRDHEGVVAMIRENFLKAKL